MNDILNTTQPAEVLPRLPEVDDLLDELCLHDDCPETVKTVTEIFVGQAHRAGLFGGLDRVS